MSETQHNIIETGEATGILPVPRGDGAPITVIGIKKMIVTADALTEWQLAMTTAVLAMLPPVAVVILMQRLFVKGLVDQEK